jgi:ubiquinone/menaquinone biosynthesis C-methylase UbiE
MDKKFILEKKTWDELANMSKVSTSLHPVLAEYKKEEFINLIKNWNIAVKEKKILKTDLYEEAFREDEILFSLTKENNKEIEVYAIDICEETVRQAKEEMTRRGSEHVYMTADVRSLPLKDNSFDFILSTSTLDHFENIEDFKVSLRELKRVLKPSGEIIIALNNICNLNFYLSCKLSELLGLYKYPTMFFRPQLARDICNEIGLKIEREAFLVHISLSFNRLVILLKRFLSDSLIDNFAYKMTSFFRSISFLKKTNILTGWFIVINCRK